jgi:hypothetical protein
MTTETPKGPRTVPLPVAPADKVTKQGSHIMSLICLGLVVLIHILAPVIWKGTFSAVSGKAIYWVIDILALVIFLVLDVVLWFQDFDNMSALKIVGCAVIVLFILFWVGIWNAQAASNVSQGLPAVYQKK